MDLSRIRQICAALRSGRYQQGHVSLCSKESTPLYCVGGVVLDIFFKSRGILFGEVPQLHLHVDTLAFAERHGIRVSVDLLEWMCCDDPAMNEFADITQKMNDDGISFSEIADRLERHYGLNPIRRVGISSEEPMNQAKIDGMKARSQGSPSTGNPFPANGSTRKNHDDWRDGWECMNSHIAQTLSNAERMFHGITSLKSGAGRVNGMAAYV